MEKKMKKNKALAIATALLLIATFSTVTANASHSWGGYHWARTANPFTLSLGHNVSINWDSYLLTTSGAWTRSPVLDTTIVSGLGGKTCKATAGQVQVCNKLYGKNGWLGIASIWISGKHITAGTVKVNDTYFNTTKYNTSAWKNLVMCQEVGHTLGLDHNDGLYTGPNNGTCMDYTNVPGGGLVGSVNYGPTNEFPNDHDYEQLGIIYANFDTTTTVKATTASTASNGNSANESNDDPSSWGKARGSKDSRGRSSQFEKDLGNGEKLITFVIWTD